MSNIEPEILLWGTGAPFLWEKAKTIETVQPGEEAQLGLHQLVLIPEGWMQREWSQVFFFFTVESGQEAMGTNQNIGGSV